jgi:enoyl-CoA hydratase
MFSAGLDLKGLPRLSTADKRQVFLRFGQLLLRIFTWRGPTVAAVTGHAIAGGALLALSTDTRLGVDLPARFGVTEIAVGLPVPNFGLLVARAALTPRELTELVLFAQVLNFREAPIFRALHPEDALLSKAVALAGELGRLPSAPFAATKRALWQRELEAIEAGMADEVARFVDLFEARFPAEAR